MILFNDKEKNEISQKLNNLQKKYDELNKNFEDKKKII